MKIIAIFKEFSDHGREMEEFIREFERRTGEEIEIRDPEASENMFFLQAYDIVEYPTILAISDDGRMLSMWRGRPLPTINDVSYYIK